MARLFYVRKATFTLFEAYPNEPEDWIVGSECRGGHDLAYPGKYGSMKSLLCAISPNDKYIPLEHWRITNLEAGRFLMTTDVLVDYTEREPSQKRLDDWKNGKAQLYHGYYSIEVRVQDIEDVPAQDIRDILGIEHCDCG